MSLAQGCVPVVLGLHLSSGVVFGAGGWVGRLATGPCDRKVPVRQSPSLWLCDVAEPVRGALWSLCVLFLPGLWGAQGLFRMILSRACKALG